MRPYFGTRDPRRYLCCSFAVLLFFTFTMAPHLSPSELDYVMKMHHQGKRTNEILDQINRGRFRKNIEAPELQVKSQVIPSQGTRHKPPGQKEIIGGPRQ